MKYWYIVSSPTLGEVFCGSEAEAKELFLEECKVHGSKAISTHVVPKYEYDKQVNEKIKAVGAYGLESQKVALAIEMLKDVLGRVALHRTGCKWCGNGGDFVLECGGISDSHKKECWYYIIRKFIKDFEI